MCFCDIYTMCKKRPHLEIFLLNSNYGHFHTGLEKKILDYWMIPSNFEWQPLINVPVFTEHSEHENLKIYSLFSVTDKNLQKEPYPCNIKESVISLTLIGALVCMMVVVGLMVVVTPI